MTKKIIITLIAVTIMVFSFNVPAYAKGRCGYNGTCEANTDNCHNGTVYCDIHAAEHMREHGYKYCAYSGCKVTITKSHTYCSSHRCRKTNDCENKAIEGSYYCTNHTNGGNKTTSSKSTTTKKTTSSTTKKTTTSKTATKSSNECLRSGCGLKKISGSNYCSNHTCSKSGCTNYASGTYCSTHTKKTTTSKNTTSKKSNKKTKMPDCDDYDSYDDFMDDWDGFMPDGSDAEDYWENW